MFAFGLPGKPHLAWSGNSYQLSKGPIGALHASRNIIVALIGAKLPSYCVEEKKFACWLPWKLHMVW